MASRKTASALVAAESEDPGSRVDGVGVIRMVDTGSSEAGQLGSAWGGGERCWM